jgi:hypothetical protein
MGLWGFGDMDVAKELQGCIHASPQTHYLAPVVGTNRSKN